MVINSEVQNCFTKIDSSLEAESTSFFFSFFFFLCCQTFTDLRKCLMSELIELDSCSLTLEEKSFTKLLLYEDARSKVKQTYTIKYID